MKSSFSQIVSRVAAMSEFEKEDWKDSLKTLIARLNDFAEEVDNDDLNDTDAVTMALRWFETDSVGLEGEQSRRADEIVSIVRKKIYEIEDEKRRRIEEEIKNRRVSETTAKAIRGLSLKLEQMRE